MKFPILSKNIKIMNFRPIFFLAVSIAVGIFSAYFYIFGKTALFVVILSLFVLSLLSFVLFSKVRKVSVIFASVFMIFSFLGGLGFSVSVKKYKDADLNDMHLVVSGKVVEVIESEGRQKLVLSDAKVNGAVKQNLHYKINVYVTDGEFKIGDIITYSSCLYDYDYLYGGDFSSGFVAEKIKYYSILSNDEVVLKGNELNLFERVKKLISDSLGRGLDGEEYSVAYSLLLGGSDVIDEEIVTSFRNTGVAHIFAVSGLHIGFLSMALSLALSKVRIKRIYKSSIIVSVLFFYSGLCGFSSSSIRAVIMASILLIGKSFGKKYDMLSSLSLAFSLILLFNPVQLFCVGFRLSFSAVLGIFLLQRKIKILLSFLPERISSGLSTSMSAQISTLPFLLKYFGKVSVVSVFVNVLFIPVVSVIFVALFGLAVLGLIFGISKITLFIPRYLIKALCFAISCFDGDIFLVSLIVTSALIMLYYIGVLFASDILNLKKVVKRICCGSMALICFIGTVLYQIEYEKQIKVTVSANSTFYSTMIDCDGEVSVILSNISNNNSLDRLKRQLKSESKIDNLIILNSIKSGDVLYKSVFQLCAEFRPINVYLPIEERELSVYRKTLISKNILSIGSIYYIQSEDLRINFIGDSSVAEIEGKGKRIIVTGKITDFNGVVEKIDKDCDLLVAYNNAEVLSEILGSRKTVVYGRSNLFYSAQSNGNYTIYL